MHLKYTFQKKDHLLPYQIWEAHDIKEQDWQGGIMFFSVKLLPIKVIKLNQIKSINNIQVQACYRKGSKKRHIIHLVDRRFSQPPTPLIHLGKINNNHIKDFLSTFPNPPLAFSTFIEITNHNFFVMLDIG